MQSTPTTTMNSYQQKDSWIRGRREVSIMGYTAGQRRLAVGRYRAACGRPAAQISYRLGESHVVLPQGDHELTELPPQAEQEEPGEHPTVQERNPQRIFSHVMSAAPPTSMNR
jgi:hypothetical protein